jgi:DNA-binding transcriptional LysR family regulator
LQTASCESALRPAETINVSSASISTAIAQMEEIVQVQLFVRRHSKGLVRTSAGQYLAAHARNILLYAREIESVAQQRWPRTIPRFSCVDGRKRMRSCSTASTPEDSISSSFYDYNIPTTLHLAPLRPMPVQVVLPASHPLAHSQRCSLQNLIDEPMALLAQPRTRDHFLSLFASKGLTPKISQRTDSIEMVRSLVANGFGHSRLTFVAPYHVVGHGKLSSRLLPGLNRSQNPVLGRLFRFRAPRLVDELNKSISAVVQMPHISAT